jgi:polysaccharide chain length determinant protein (PEP-CTERM system associated)
MDESIQEKLRILLKEAYLKKKLFVYSFIIISLLVMVLGLFVPKHYTSEATIVVQQQNIIQPLMEGTAVATDIGERARQARELIDSRQFLNKVMDDVGWTESSYTPLELEKIRDALKARIKLETTGDNLIAISYSDNDPVRAKLIVDRLTQNVIADSQRRKSEESRRAYEFIDSQVSAYHQKLVDAENKLKEFRSEKTGARMANESEIGRRIASLRSEIESTKLGIAEEKIRMHSLEKQLSGEAGLTSSMTREGQYLSRIAELQNELDTLLLSYTETHPDVIVLKHQIEDLKKAIAKEKERGRSVNKGQAKNGDTYVDEGVRMSPLYETLRTQLSHSRTQIDTLNARLKENEKLLNEEIELSKKVHSSEAVLSELNRDQAVNQQIYNDLLRRRENARVSMNMDISQKGLDMKIYEPAYLPLKPSGLRLLHFAIAGLVLGLVIPTGIMAIYLELDQNIRSKKKIEQEFGLAVITTIPHWVDHDESGKIRAENVSLLSMLMLSMIAYVCIGLARIKGVI